METQTDTVKVLAFGSVAQIVGWTEKAYPCTGGAPLWTLIEVLDEEFPKLARAKNQIRWAVNAQYATEDVRIEPGDEVAIIPPVSGGMRRRALPTRRPTARIVHEAIDMGSLISEVEGPDVSAIVTFQKVVEHATDEAGNTLRVLDYSGYEYMALAEMCWLCEEIIERHKLRKIVLVHRLGKLRVGQTVFATVIAAENREEAFAACKELYNAVQESVPIFKKQVWQQGDPTWVNGIA